MSNEITVTAELRFAKSGAMDGLSLGPATFTLTGTRYEKGRQSIGFAAEEVLNLGEVVAGGWCMIRNLDATNYVTIRAAAAATPLVRINAGEIALFRIHQSATAPTAQANTAACEVEYLVLEA